MLIGAGIALYLLLFMGGSQNDLLILHGEKYVKKVVAEKDRKELILAEFKSISKLQKEYQKVNKQNTKYLAGLVTDYGTDKATFDEFFKKLAEEEGATNEKFNTYRSSIQEQLTQEEWDQVMDHIQKSIAKDEKTAGKSFATFEKDLEKMKSKILDILNEDFRREKAEASLDDFITTVKKSGEEILKYAPEEKEMLQKKETSKAELNKLGDDIIGQWIELLNAVADLHGDLKKVTTEEEWKSVSKWLNKI